MVMFCTDSCEVKKTPANLPYDYYDLLLEPARFPEEQHNFEQTRGDLFPYFLSMKLF
jgi:hypothetical protein